MARQFQMRRICEFNAFVKDLHAIGTLWNVQVERPLSILL